MDNIFFIAQIVLSVILIILIMLQTKGAGFGGAFGGSLSFYRSRRGFERMLFILTIIIASLFLLSSLVRLII